jgi:hypothetical protein
MSTRTFRDEGGTDWQAWEVLPGTHLTTRMRLSTLLPDDMAGGWLTFESASEKRRVYPIPPGWEDASDDMLRLLLRAAASVRMVPASPA